MDIVQIITISMGIAWASGINLYATLATLGILAATGHATLPAELQILAHPWVIAAAGFMYCVEFFADKVPGVDTAWDTVHSFIRIPAGAILAATAMAQVSPEAQLAALIIGGGLAATSHTLKTGTRVLINASPEPFTNWGASLLEDAVVIGGVCLALFYPFVFLALLAAFVIAAVWMIPKIWRGIRRVTARVRELFGGEGGTAQPAAAPASDAPVWPYAERLPGLPKGPVRLRLK